MNTIFRHLVIVIFFHILLFPQYGFASNNSIDELYQSFKSYKTETKNKKRIKYFSRRILADWLSSILLASDSYSLNHNAHAVQLLLNSGDNIELVHSYHGSVHKNSAHLSILYSSEVNKDGPHKIIFKFIRNDNTWLIDGIAKDYRKYKKTDLIYEDFTK